MQRVILFNLTRPNQLSKVQYILHGGARAIENLIFKINVVIVVLPIAE